MVGIWTAPGKPLPQAGGETGKGPVSLGLTVQVKEVGIHHQYNVESLNTIDKAVTWSRRRGKITSDSV